MFWPTQQSRSEKVALRTALVYVAESTDSVNLSNANIEASLQRVVVVATSVIDELNGPKV